MASVRQLASGRWELRVSVGHDPLTGKYRYKSKVADAANKKDAQRKANAWELELADGSLSGDGGTFGQLCESWVRHKTRRWSPSTLKEHRRIVDRYLAKSSWLNQLPRRPIAWATGIAGATTSSSIGTGKPRRRAAQIPTHTPATSPPGMPSPPCQTARTA